MVYYVNSSFAVSTPAVKWGGGGGGGGHLVNNYVMRLQSMEVWLHVLSSMLQCMQYMCIDKGGSEGT